MTEEKPSGLRNPQGAVRGVGAGALAAEGLVLLLAIVPMKVLGGARGAGTVAVVVVLAVVSFALAGLLSRSWAWHAGSALQVVLFVCGLIFHVALAVLGVLFGLVWIYVLYVRRSVLGKAPQ
jgi:hypothetical protein